MQHEPKSNHDARTAEMSVAPVHRGSKMPAPFQRLPYLRWIPSYAWQRLTHRQPSGPVHLVFGLADHFEPAIVPEDGSARAPYDEQERRLEAWCRDYPRAVEQWRDHYGRPLVHTYFYPAEQYDRAKLRFICITASTFRLPQRIPGVS
jgi:hypothetical protein